jgi:hypothetical protein
MTVTYYVGQFFVMLVLTFVTGWAWGSHRAHQHYLRRERDKWFRR